MTEIAVYENEIVANKNKNEIRCQYCNSLMLKSENADYAENEYKLPLMHQKNSKDVAEIESEDLRNWWTVDNMFTFENIGVSNQVDNTKFLICADCEMGPVGYYTLSDKKCFIALQRVKHIAI